MVFFNLLGGKIFDTQADRNGGVFYFFRGEFNWSVGVISGNKGHSAVMMCALVMMKAQLLPVK
ncbi:MAG: hypothetical protein FWD52_09500 [Candidatus Bathyarchaeota archaeon]|nr:hypothetical protein [Candidatus Termiticorpusculum sp.]